MEVKFTALSEIGHVRAHNEDSYGISENTPNGSVYVVCDGMGGHVGGATASRLAVESILEYFKKEKYDNLILEIDKAFQFANEQIFAHTLAEPQLKGMGTTAVVLIIKKEECYIGHVGDSRIYIKSDTKLHRLTKDHSYVQGLVDSGVISDDEAEKHPQKNQILRALGHTSDVKGSICKKPFKVKIGDVFLLCTDGLNGMINDSVIENTINGNDLEKSKHKLFEAAMVNGGLDNVTILLVQVAQSKYYGSNDFTSYNPIVRGREDNFDKTSGFSKTQQINNAQRPATKKKKWIPYLFYGSVGIIALTLSLFFIFRNNEPNPKGPIEQAIKIDNSQDLGLTSSDLSGKSLEELQKLVGDTTKLLDPNISNTDINLSDGKTVTLVIRDRNLISVKEKEIVETIENDPVVNNVNKEKKSVSSTVNSTNDCLNGDKSDELKPLDISKSLYTVEAAAGGETFKKLEKRIANPEYGCKNKIKYEDLIDLNKKNPKIKKEKNKINPLDDENGMIEAKTPIIIKCECDQ
jgi:serine/threonine protein phosphatase PrpC